MMGDGATRRRYYDRTKAYGAICRHCRVAAVNRPRGLCWSCYYTDGVKALYPIAARWAKVSDAPTAGSRPLPPEPTTAAPGTPEKVAVMERRYKARVSVLHPADARYEGDPRPLEFMAANTQERTAG